LPPTLLAIDTATEICSVALALGNRILEHSESVGQKHSERILPMVHGLLRAAELQLTDCDTVAFGAGPGAFTGLRIACGIAQGLAFGAGKPVIAVGNLAALALAASAKAPGARRILAAIDARMQEVYWACYSIDDGELTEISAPALAAAGELAAICRRSGADLVAGSALRAFPEAVASLGLTSAPDARAGAGAIATLAAKTLAAGGAVSPALASPIYVRDRVALTIDERRAAAAAAAGRR